MENPSRFPNSSECLDSLLAEFALGTLDSETAALLQRVSLTHQDLAKRLQDDQTLLLALTSCIPTVKAPPSLRRRIHKIPFRTGFYSSVLASLFGHFSRHVSFISHPDRPRWGLLMTLVGGAILLGVGIDDVLLRRQLAKIDAAIVALQGSTEQHALQNVSLLETTVSALQGSHTRLFSLRGTPASNQASGSVILDLQSGVALVALQNLPPLPESQAYHLWAFTADQKIRCGTFNTNSNGEIVDKIAIAQDQYKNPVLYVRISKESITIPPNPTEKALVMTSEL